MKNLKNTLIILALFLFPLLIQAQTYIDVNIIQPHALTATVIGTDVNCFGDSTGIAVLTVSGGALAYSYLWNTGDTTKDLSNIPAGTYSATITDANSCSVIASVVINQPAVPATPVITQNGNDLTSSSATGNQWYELTTGIITGAIGQTYTVTVSGDYFVVVSNGTCFSDTSNIIHVTITGIQTIDGNSSIAVFPNPTNDAVKVCLHNLENKNIRIDVFNSIGQTIIAKQLSVAKSDMIETFDLSKFSNGIFLFKFEIGANRKIFRIIKN